VAERVVVPLESGDVDEADRAPAAALFEREKRLELLGKAPEVHELGLRIAMRLVGQIGDEPFEIAGDAADGRVLGQQLRLDVRHLVGEAGRERLNGLVLRLLPEPLVTAEHRVDRREERRLECGRELQSFADPSLQLVTSLRLGVLRLQVFKTHEVALGHIAQ
jgi:hypothetical protein